MSTSGASRWREIASDLNVELSLFFCSYAPLFAILAVRFHRCSLTVVCGVLAFVGLLAGLLVLRRFRSVTASVWAVRRVDDRGGEVAGYLASYLLPFVTVAEPGWRDIVGYIAFIAIVAVVYIRSGLVQINPTLYLFGWRLFAIDIGEGWSGYLLARRPAARGEEIYAVRMTERLFVNYAKRDPDADPAAN